MKESITKKLKVKDEVLYFGHKAKIISIRDDHVILGYNFLSPRGNKVHYTTYAWFDQIEPCIKVA